jgi:GR25 family glycosyltransferase involved in LPS biosynthesis
MICKVIGLERRQDRLDMMPAEMGKIGLEWEFYPAIDPVPDCGYMRNTAYSFTEILKDVTGDLLVLETDVTFVYQVKEIFEKAISQLPDDWDMLYLGGNIHIPAERFSDNLFRIKSGVHCNHAILYSEKGRETIFKNYDWQTNEIVPFDEWLYHVGQGLMNCFICSPMIAFQRPGFSDYSKCFSDYYIDMRSHEIKFLV